MLENWYKLASNIPGQNATVFETCQLEIYEISVFLKATRKLACLAFVFLHEPVVVGMHATYCNLEPKLRFEISKHRRHAGLKLTHHCLEQLL